MRKLCWVLPLLLACSENDLTKALEGGDNAAPENNAVRIDLYPPAADPPLLPQTHVFVGSTSTEESARFQNLQVGVKPTVRVSGTLTAEVAEPYGGAITAPTQVVPLAGEVRAWIDGSLQRTGVVSDADGWFEMDLVADTHYDLAIVPSDATQAPFLTFDDITVRADRDLSREVALGTPLYGRVEDAAGNAIGGARLVLNRVDVDVATDSAVLVADERGWFVARVEEGGSYAVTVVGGLADGGRTVPTVTAVAETVSADGAMVTLDLGVLDSNTYLTAAVLDAHGERLRDATVRLTSTSLEAGEGRSLTQETHTDGQGLFVVRLLPGEYELEVIPAATEQAPTTSPARAPVHIASGANTLPDIALGAAGVLVGDLTTPAGAPAPDVLVFAEQLEFGGFRFQGRTDAAGHFEMPVPRGAYTVTFTPTVDMGAIKHATMAADVPTVVGLAAGTEVSGVVVVGEVPLPWAYLEVRHPETGDLLGSTTTGQDGTFSVRVDVPVLAEDPDGEEDDTGGGDTGTGDTGPSVDTADTGAGGDTGAESDTGGADSGDSVPADTADTGGDTGGKETGGNDTGAGDTGSGDTGAADTGARETGASDTAR